MAVGNMLQFGLRRSLKSVSSSFCDSYNNSYLCNKYSKYAARETRFMTKFLSKGIPKKKFKVFETVPSTQNIDSITKPSKKVNTRRITVLNKLFMQHITDLLATGNWQNTLIDKGIEITKVAVTPDFKNLNVFWFSSIANEDIEPMLINIAHKMHHELSQLQLMGSVPKIIFVKDKHKEKLLELEKFLDKISSESSTHNDQVEEENVVLEIRQPMVMNVYGLEHDKIMNKIGFGSSKKHSSSDMTEKGSEKDMSETEGTSKKVHPE